MEKPWIHNCERNRSIHWQEVLGGDANLGEDNDGSPLENTNEVFLIKLAVERRPRNLEESFEADKVRAHPCCHWRLCAAVVWVGADLAQLVPLMRRSIVPSHRLPVDAGHFCHCLHQRRVLQVKVAVIEDTRLGPTPTLFAEIVEVTARLESLDASNETHNRTDISNLLVSVRLFIVKKPGSSASSLLSWMIQKADMTADNVYERGLLPTWDFPIHITALSNR